MSTKTALAIAATAMLLAFVYQVGSRLSQQALDMTIGMVCGLAATVPVSLGLVAALIRERQREDESFEMDSRQGQEGWRYPEQGPRQPYPPVIVISPPNASSPYAGVLPPGYLQTPPYARDFRIVGEEEEEGD